MDEAISIDKQALLLLHMGAILYVLYLLALEAINVHREDDNDND